MLRIPNFFYCRQDRVVGAPWWLGQNKWYSTGISTRFKFPKAIRQYGREEFSLPSSDYYHMPPTPLSDKENSGQGLLAEDIKSLVTYSFQKCHLED